MPTPNETTDDVLTPRPVLMIVLLFSSVIVLLFTACAAEEVDLEHPGTFGKWCPPGYGAKPAVTGFIWIAGLGDQPAYCVGVEDSGAVMFKRPSVPEGTVSALREEGWRPFSELLAPVEVSDDR